MTMTKEHNTILLNTWIEQNEVKKLTNFTTTLLKNVTKKKTFNTFADQFKLSFNDNKLTIEHFNIDTGTLINGRFNLMIDNPQPISICLPAKDLNNILKKIKSSLEITITELNILLKASCSGFTSTLFYTTGDEYPKNTLDKLEYSFIHENIQEYIKLVQKAILSAEKLKDNSNNVLSTIYHHFDDNNKLQICSTDGNRVFIGYFNNRIPSTKTKFQACVKHPGLLMLTKFKSLTNKLYMDFTNDCVKFTFDNITIIQDLIDGRYPDYLRLCPVHYEDDIKFNKKELAQAIDNIIPCVNTRTNLVRFKVNKDKLVVSGNTADKGIMESEINIINPKESIFEAGFNYKFVLDALKSTDSEIITIEHAGILQPFLFFDDKALNYNLVMPVQIK